MTTNEPLHSPEAERAVLGAVLLDSGAWPDVRHLTTSDFYRRSDHRAVYAAVATLFEEGRPCDALTVAEQLDHDGAPAPDGGWLAFVGEIAENTPSAANAATYAGIVADKARLRDIANAGAEAAKAARAPNAKSDDVAARMRAVFDALPATAPGAEAWPSVTAGRLLNEEDESLDWLVNGLLPAGGTSLLFGAPKSGKSSLARVLASKVAIGAPWQSRETRAGAVLYVALDERRSTVREHVRTLVNASTDGAMLRERLHVALGPRPAGGVAALRAVIERINPAPVLVVVDTLMKLEPFEDANDYGQSGQSMARVTALAADTGAHVMLVHHARKEGATEADPATAALGSTRIGADVDVLALVKVRKTDKHRLVSFIGRDGVNAADLDVTFAGTNPSGGGNPYA